MSTLGNGKAFHLSLVILLALYGTAIGRAQGGRDSTGTGGIHTIQGRVFFPTDRSSDGRVKVELETSERGNLSTLTGPDGSFRFSNLLAGSYTVVVDGGGGFELARESVYIERDKMSRTVTVPIYLRYKKSVQGTARAGVLDAALAPIPKQALEQYEKGLRAAQAAESQKAIEYFHRAVALYPNFGSALNELGVQYLKIGKADRAAEALQAAVKLMPTGFPMNLNYGIALLNKNDYVAAETQLRRAVKINDLSAVARMYLGIALVKRRKYDEAEKELRRAVDGAAAADVSMAHKYLGGLYWSRREYQRAAAELEKYLELSPQASDANRVRETIQELRTKQ